MANKLHINVKPKKKTPNDAQTDYKTIKTKLWWLSAMLLRFDEMLNEYL